MNKALFLKGSIIMKRIAVIDCDIIAFRCAAANEKVGRLLALIPMYMEIEHEARATISRLRDENERLKSARIEDL